MEHPETNAETPETETTAETEPASEATKTERRYTSSLVLRTLRLTEPQWTLVAEAAEERGVPQAEMMRLIVDTYFLTTRRLEDIETRLRKLERPRT